MKIITTILITTISTNHKIADPLNIYRPVDIQIDDPKFQSHWHGGKLRKLDVFSVEVCHLVNAVEGRKGFI